jgi:hypothetical protein
MNVQFGIPNTYKVWFEQYIYPRIVKVEDSSNSNIQFIIEDSVKDFLFDGGIFRDDHGKIFDVIITQDEKTLHRFVKEIMRVLTCARQAFHQILTINEKRKMTIQEMEQAPNIQGETQSTQGMTTSTNDSKGNETNHSRKAKPTLSSSKPRSNAKLSSSEPKSKSTLSSSKPKSKSKSSSTSSPKTKDLLENDTKKNNSKRKSRNETIVSKSKKKMKIHEKKQTKGCGKPKIDATGTRKGSDKTSPSKPKTKSFTKRKSGTPQSPSTSTQMKEPKAVPQEISISSEDVSLQDNSSLVTQDDSYNVYDASLSLNSFEIRGASSKASLVSDIHVYDSAISRFVNVSNPKMYTYMVDKLNHLFKCPVCLEIMENVYIVPICLHRICYICAESSIRKCSHRCPECRVHVPTKRILRNDERYQDLKIQIFGEGGIAETIGRNNQVQNDSLRKSMTSYFLCSSCKALPNKTFVVPECMHRFCSDCLGDDCDSCPECNIQITSKLPIREDAKFDELRHILISDGGLLD